MLDYWPNQLEELGFVFLLCNLNSDNIKRSGIWDIGTQQLFFSICWFH